MLLPRRFHQEVRQKFEGNQEHGLFDLSIISAKDALRILITSLPIVDCSQKILKEPVQMTLACSEERLHDRISVLSELVVKEYRITLYARLWRFQRNAMLALSFSSGCSSYQAHGYLMECSKYLPYWVFAFILPGVRSQAPSFTNSTSVCLATRMFKECIQSKLIPIDGTRLVVADIG